MPDRTGGTGTSRTAHRNAPDHETTPAGPVDERATSPVAQGGGPTDVAGFATMLGRLNRLSAIRRNDAFEDVPWDEHDLDPTDLRLVLPQEDPLAATDWYRSLPPDEQARIGLLRIVASLQTAWHFENILQQGLLHRALYMSQDRPHSAEEFRYIHNEVIEESNHTLMFHELIERSGFGVRGMHFLLRHLAAWLMRILGRHSPVVFFAMVLGGEEPLDLLQRRTLAQPDLHPLVERIMRIHVAEEARHISYARSAIRHEAAELGRVRRQTVAFFTPLALGIMVRLMAQPTHDLAVGGVPVEVARRSYRSPAGRRLLIDGVARIRGLLGDLGLTPAPARMMWRALRIWE